MLSRRRHDLLGAAERRDVRLEDNGLTADLADFAGGALHLRHEQIDDRDVVARSRERLGTGSADPARATGDKRDFARIRFAHVPHPLSEVEGQATPAYSVQQAECSSRI